MNKLLLAAVVALLCIQALHGTPVSTDGTDEGTTVETTETKDGITTVTRTTTYADGSTSTSTSSYSDSTSSGSWSGSFDSSQSGGGEGTSVSASSSSGSTSSGSWSGSSQSGGGKGEGTTVETTETKDGVTTVTRTTTYEDGSTSVSTSSSSGSTSFGSSQSGGGKGEGTTVETTETKGGVTTVTRTTTYEDGSTSTETTSSSSQTSQSGGTYHYESGSGGSTNYNFGSGSDSNYNFDFDDDVHGGAPCTHGSIDFSDDQLEALDSEEYDRQTDIIQVKRVDECFKQLAAISKENDKLRQQAVNANIMVATLTTQNSELLEDKDKCEDQFNCLMYDLKILTTDNSLLEKKLTACREEVQRLRTELQNSNNAGLTIKTKYENLYIEYNKQITIINQYKVTISTQQTTINNLRQENTDITIKINNCGSQSAEYKSKYESEVTKTTRLQGELNDRDATIADLRAQITKLTADLKACRNTNGDLNVEISNFKTTIINIKNENSQCSGELQVCNVRLDKVTKDFNVDEMDDVERETLLEQTTVFLNQCKAQVTEITINYESEKKRADTCDLKVVSVREECAARYTKYELDITQLTVTFQGRIEKCEFDLDVERKTIVEINLYVNTLKTDLVNIKSELSISIQSQQDLQLKFEGCEKNAVILQETITSLRVTISTTTEQYNSCVSHTNSVQSELTEAGIRLSACQENLSESEKTLSQRETVIVKLNADIQTLEASVKQCNADLTTVRCNTNKFVLSIDRYQNEARVALDSVIDLINKSVDGIAQFPATTNLDCATCSKDEPCLIGGEGDEITVAV